MQKRVLSFLMVLAMVFSLLPMGVLAEGEATDPQTTETTFTFTFEAADAHVPVANGELAVNVKLEASADEMAVSGFQMTFNGLPLKSFTLANAELTAASISEDQKTVVWGPHAEESMTVGTTATTVATAVFTVAEGTTLTTLEAALNVDEERADNNDKFPALTVLGDTEHKYVPAIAYGGCDCTDAAHADICGHALNATWTALTTELVSTMATGTNTTYKTLPSGNYYLNGDLALAYTLEIPADADVVICLNGYTLTARRGTANANMLRVTNANATVTIEDCTASGTLKANGSSYGGIARVAAATATLSIANCIIDGSNGSTSTSTDIAGVALYVANQGGTINVYDSVIQNFVDYPSVNHSVIENRGTMYLKNVTFDNCGGRSGVITSLVNGTNTDSTTLENCVFKNTQAPYAVKITTTCDSVIVEGDTAADKPIYIESDKDLTVGALGENADVSFKTASMLTERNAFAGGTWLTATADTAVPLGTLTYDNSDVNWPVVYNAEAADTEEDPKFTLESHVHDGIVFQALTAENAALLTTSNTEGGNYYLAEDIYTDRIDTATNNKNKYDVQLFADVNLCLCGHDLIHDVSGGRTVTLGNDAGSEKSNFTVYDCAVAEYDELTQTDEYVANAGKIIGSGTTTVGGRAVYVSPNSTFTLVDGVVQAATGNTNYGGAVAMATGSGSRDGGVFNMQGGVITGSSATGAGTFSAVALRGSSADGANGYIAATFNMTGGLITGNTNAADSSNVSSAAVGAMSGSQTSTGGHCVINISGGKIESTGRAISASESASVNLSGGEVIGEIRITEKANATITGAAKADDLVLAGENNLYVNGLASKADVTFTKNGITADITDPDDVMEVAEGGAQQTAIFYNVGFAQPSGTEQMIGYDAAADDFYFVADTSKHMHGTQEYVAWTNASALPTEAEIEANPALKYIYLTCDVQLTDTYTMNEDLTICLNGYDIIAKSGKRAITIGKSAVTTTVDGHYTARTSTPGVTLTLDDCSAYYDLNGNYVAGAITGGKSTFGAAIGIWNYGSKLILNQGKLSGNGYSGSSSAGGGAVWMRAINDTLVAGNTYSNGTITSDINFTHAPECEFIMNGGEISDNHVTTSNASVSGGGAVEVTGAGCTFVMNGGAILNNSITNTNANAITNKYAAGGAIYAGAGANVTINSGTITGNNADFGGVIYITGSTTNVKIKEGSFCENSAYQGGVVWMASGNLTVTGGTFNNNTATNFAGAFMFSGGTASVTGTETITGNTASVTGGVFFIQSTAEVKLTGIKATGNTAKSASVLNIQSDTSKCWLKDVEFTGNSASGYGAVNVANAKSQLYLEGATKITGNTNISDNSALNMHLQAATATEIKNKVNKVVYVDGLTEGAEIGISLLNTRITNGHYFFTADMENDIPVEYFFSDNSAYGVVKLTREVEISNAGTDPMVYADTETTRMYIAAAAYNDTPYLAAADAIAAYTADTETANKWLILGTDVETLDVNGTLNLDLNGQTVTTLNVEEGETLNAIDSCTNDFAGEAGKITTLNNTGTVNNPSTGADGKQYVKLGDTADVSFHHVDASIDNKVLRYTEELKGAAGFRAYFSADSAIAAKIEDKEDADTYWGWRVTIDDAEFTNYEDVVGTVGTFVEGGNKRFIILPEILAGDDPTADAKKMIYAKPFITVDGEKIFGDAVATSLMDLVNYANGAASDTQKSGIKKMLQNAGITGNGNGWTIDSIVAAQ